MLQPLHQLAKMLESTAQLAVCNYLDASPSSNTDFATHWACKLAINLEIAESGSATHIASAI